MSDSPLQIRIDANHDTARKAARKLDDMIINHPHDYRVRLVLIELVDAVKQQALLIDLMNIELQELRKRPHPLPQN